MKTAVVNQTASTRTKVHLSGRIVLSLLMRTMLFFTFGFAIAGIFALAGHEQPFQTAMIWWPFQGIMANTATFFILKYWFRTEGERYSDLFRVKKGEGMKHVKQVLLLLLVGFVLGGVPLYLFSYLLLGTLVPPDTMLQAMPLWAAVISLLLFPLTNALVETPTYIGYSFSRIQQKLGSVWMAALLAGLALALQHIAMPIVSDVPFMLWRVLSFLPLAIALGFIYNRTKKLLPIIIVHFIMDLQLTFQIYINSSIP
jgi:membrane protease YdiL (CAAX protease family)